MFRRLSHSRHITDYDYFFFYEFEIPEEFCEFSFEEIITNFVKTYYFTDEFHEYKKESKSEYVAHDAFLINKITIDDFRKIKGKDVEKVVLSEIKRKLGKPRI